MLAQRGPPVPLCRKFLATTLSEGDFYAQVVAALHAANMCIKSPFENEYLAIVSPEDERCIEINSRHPTFLPFLNRFTDTFRRKAIPSVFLMRDDAPPWVKSMEAVGAFQDILSICAVVYNRTAVLIHHLSRNYQYSTSFEFYAYTLSIDYQMLVTSNPALAGFDLVEEFYGQATAGLPVSNWDRLDYDETVLKALLAEWERRFSNANTTWRSTALFRSLNMAHAAAQIPGVVGVTNYSLGRNISLWVSAFEILVHPGEEDEGGSSKSTICLTRSTGELRPARKIPTHATRVAGIRKVPHETWRVGFTARYITHGLTTFMAIRLGLIGLSSNRAEKTYSTMRRHCTGSSSARFLA